MLQTLSINLDGKTIQYTLSRSNRKTIGIIISKDLRVTVKAPNKVSLKQMEDVVRQKAHWIIRKLTEIETAARETPHREYSSGEKLLFLGQEYVLKVLDGDTGLALKVYISSKEMCVSIPYLLSDEAKARKVRGLLLNWYLEKVALLFKQRVEIYDKLLNVHPAKIAIKDIKTRWGSASYKRNINLNWRLVMAPLNVVDYVVVHELCHLKEMNHSKAFWSHVESILPDYKEYRRWLKENGHKLYL
jgi:predicted metal-dependent hydrolase